MKRFNFKLEKILKYRKIIKDLQQIKVNRAAKLEDETKKYLDELDIERHAVYESMISNIGDGFSLVHQQGQETINRKLDFEKSKEKIRLVKRKKALEVEQNKLVKANQNEKTISKLKDKAKELHTKECLYLEMKQIDDLSNTRFCQEK